MKSKFVHRLSSVIRPSSVRVAIISEPNARITFKFHLWLLRAIRRTNFFNLKKIFFFDFYEYFSSSLTWDPMGAKISKGRAKMSSISTPWGRKSIYVQLLEL